MIRTAVLAGLNHVLGQSAWARQRLAPFAGRHARLSMPPWRLRLAVTGDGLFEAAVDETAPDVEITLPAEAPFFAFQDRERVMQAVRVEGGAEFATELAYVLKNLRWDFEEDLSRAVGDIAAHRLAGGLAAFADWQKEAAARFAENLGTYITAEAPLLVAHADYQAFADDVAASLTAVERAERRVEALAQSLGSQPSRPPSAL